MTLEQVMHQKNFVVMGNTTEPGKPAREIKEKIKRQTEKYGWEFIFLAANIDAVETADNLGIRRDRAANYRQTNRGVERSYYAMSEAISTVRMGCAEKMDLAEYLKEDEEND